MGAWRRLAGDGRVGDLTLHELDEFVSEDGVRPNTAPALLMSVPAYPEQETGAISAASSRATVRRPHLVASAWRGICAVVLAPFALVGFIVLRIYWLAWWAVYGTWRGVTGTVALIVWTLGAIAHGIQRAIVGAAGAGAAVVRGVWHGVSATCAWLVGGAVALVTLTSRTVLRGVRAVLHLSATVARSTVHGGQRVSSSIVDAGAAVVRGVGHAALASHRFVVGSAAALIALTSRAAVRGVHTVVHASALVARQIGHAASALYRFVVGGAFALFALTSRAAVRGVHATLHASATVAREIGHAASASYTVVVGGAAALIALTIRTVRRGGHVARHVCLTVARATVHGARQTVSATVEACAGVSRGVSRGASNAWGRLIESTGHAARRAQRESTGLVHLVHRMVEAGSVGARRVWRDGVDVAGRAGKASAAAMGSRRAAASATIARALAARVRVRVRLAGPLPPTTRAWGRPVVLRSAVAVGVVGLATTAAMSLVPRHPAARAAVTGTPAPVERSQKPAAAPIVLAAVLPSRPETAARPAPRRPAPVAAKRPVAPRPRPANNDARPAVAVPAPAMNADTVRALWRETDTRSLDRAISAVRQATLALRRCNVQMTSADHAVARCDVAQGSGAAARGVPWTFEFRRTDERWLIDSISTRAAP